MVSEDYLTKSEAIVLIDERINKHDVHVNEPKHKENLIALKGITTKVDALVLIMAKMEATQAIVMKFAGAGVIIWSLKQLAELVQTFKH